MKKIKSISLIEMVIAFSIFAAAFSPFFIMITGSKKGIKRGENYFRAVLLTEKAMEEISSLIYYCPNLGLPKVRKYKAFPKYNIKIKRRLVDNELFEVKVITNWYEKGTREVSLSTKYSTRASSTYNERVEYPWDKK